MIKNDSTNMFKIFTLVFVKKNRNLLLGLKTRGLGVGFWNGFGGKVEAGESVVEAALRELKEECNLETRNLKQIGIITYEEENNCNSIVHVFTTSEVSGMLKESEEMNPVKWYNYSDIPFANMWPDSKYWYHLMLNDKYFTAVIRYDTYKKISYRIQELSLEQFLSIMNR